MNSFQDAALRVLSGIDKPLHYKDITSEAIKEGHLQSKGKTPWASMNAQLSVDIKDNGLKSRFIRTQPGYFALNPYFEPKPEKRKHWEQFIVNENLTTKQKGDIVEARVAELITLYGDEGLSCYKPVSDDEGIDLIVKRRGKLEVVYIQVKSTYGDGRSKGFTSIVKEQMLKNKSRMLIVFVYFDFSEGDLYDQVFCIPAPEFINLTNNKKRKTSNRVFTVSLKSPDKSKYAKFMIEKRELANKIIEIMDKL